MTDQLPSTQPNAEARKWAMLCHYAAFAWLIMPMVANVLGPLIVWQLKKELDPFVDEQGKEALNFQITVSIALMVSGALMWVLVGFPLAALISLAALILTIIAGIKANTGEHYRYPLCLRLVK